MREKSYVFLFGFLFGCRFPLERFRVGRVGFRIFRRRRILCRSSALLLRLGRHVRVEIDLHVGPIRVRTKFELLCFGLLRFSDSFRGPRNLVVVDHVVELVEVVGTGSVDGVPLAVLIRQNSDSFWRLFLFFVLY